MFTDEELEALTNPTVETKESLLASVQYAKRRRQHDAELASEELAAERERIRQRGGFF